jgi:hypothetical protein
LTQILKLVLFGSIPIHPRPQTVIFMGFGPLNETIGPHTRTRLPIEERVRTGTVAKVKASL